MANSTSPTNGSSIRILIVDDHPNTAVTLARAITQIGSGIEVTSADCGERALDLVREKAADLLITDMMMPGMNGLELIEKLQSIPGGHPTYTILITAYDVPGGNPECWVRSGLDRPGTIRPGCNGAPVHE